MMHPGRLRGQHRKKLRCVKVGLSFLKNGKHGNSRKQGVFWCEVLSYMESKTQQHGRRTYDMVLEKLEDGALIRGLSEEANTNVEDNDEDEVQEIRRPEGRDKEIAAGRKNKWSKSSASSSVNEDALARLMVTEMGAQEKEERLTFLEIKRKEVECRKRELEQQDMRFYLQPYDHLVGDQRKAMDEIRAKIKAKYNLQY
ncbi:hypothetical protein Tco_0528656 [Tanacetum coccineum]